MRGHQLTPSDYALQHIVKSLSNLHFKFEEHRLRHPDCVVCCFLELENIDYAVLRHPNTGVQPQEEFFAEWLFDRDV
jgi:hypothetical protein